LDYLKTLADTRGIVRFNPELTSAFDALADPTGSLTSAQRALCGPKLR